MNPPQQAALLGTPVNAGAPTITADEQAEGKNAIRGQIQIVQGLKCVCENRRTADLSTPLRSGRDDNSY
jgi:hypothetical protein